MYLWTRNHFSGVGSASLVVLIGAGIVFSLLAIGLSRFLVKPTWSRQKLEPYECGVPTIGKTWIQYNVGYYLFALMFLIFEVELVFLFPWAVVVKQLGMVALIEAAVFLFILFLGFLYAHRQGALKWM
ncbi:MAG: NADH-quinone oxidoreductase subunit A [Chitinophagales bacterium]|nr:NADH-quinone oxidoreductase subunit A [Chitinophagales bacterium]MDW8427641.1 NADH-quinone oxidoreductase subunit A [Chitinophagales bacterium]